MWAIWCVLVQFVSRPMTHTILVYECHSFQVCFYCLRLILICRHKIREAIGANKSDSLVTGEGDSQAHKIKEIPTENVVAWWHLMFHGYFERMYGAGAMQQQ